METNYWELTPRERALLSQDEVKDFTDYELMRKGVIRVLPPNVLPIESVTPATHDYYAVKETYGQPFIAFETMEKVEAFLKLAPLMISSEWETDSKVAKYGDLFVTVEKIMDAQEHQRLAAVLKKNREAKRANEKAQEEYEANAKKQRATLDELWDDWHDQCSHESDAQSIVRIFNEYVERCRGDREIALRFLEKVKTDSEIRFAFEWLGMPTPYQADNSGAAVA